MRDREFDQANIERLVAGGIPEDEELAAIAPLIEALKRLDEGHLLTDAYVDDLAAEAARVARVASRDPLAVGTRRPEPSRRSFRLGPRLAGALAALLTVSSVSGAAIAADSAVPGDALYGLDRALERVGIGDGGLAERLQEAGVLAERGSLVAALAHAADAFAQIGAGDEAARSATEALRAAGDAVSRAEEGDSGGVRSRAAELLRWMATTDAGGVDLGRDISSRARGVVGDETPVTEDQDGTPARRDGAGQGVPRGQVAPPPPSAPAQPAPEVPRGDS